MYCDPLVRRSTNVVRQLNGRLPDTASGAFCVIVGSVIIAMIVVMVLPGKLSVRTKGNTRWRRILLKIPMPLRAGRIDVQQPQHSLAVLVDLVVTNHA